MGNTPSILTTAELSGWSMGGIVPVDYSPLGEHKALVVRLERSTDAEPIAAWLRRLVCPVIGLLDGLDDGLAGVDTELANACDVLAVDEAEAVMLVGRAEANPQAASTLVELLRITENMPLADALRVESLAYATLQTGSEYADWLAALAVQPPAPKEDGPAVLLERKAAVLDMVLNRPGNRNAMSVEMRDALNEALQLVLSDESIETLRIAGRGKCFSTGGDLAEFGTVPNPATGHIVRGLTVPGSLLARCSDRVTVHVHGACIGSGVEFPAFAGRITATNTAHFQLPEVGMGLIPGAGGCVSIARRMGRQRCAWLALSGKRMKARQALEWGLIDEIVD
jgi:enoyl-CoA hydratase/carnithine racemase